MRFKRFLLRVFFIAEILFCGWFFLFGEHSLLRLDLLKKENDIFLSEVLELEKFVKKLEDEVEQWKQNPFYHEKIVRENLQMVRPGEQVYYIE